MKCSSQLTTGAFTLLLSFGFGACAKPAPAESPEPAAEVAASEAQHEPLAEPVANEEQYFVEGVAGGAMIRTLEIEAEVVSVNQEQREAVLRDKAGNETTVKVGKEARNFYQVQPGDRVMVTMARELVIYVEEGKAGESEQQDGTAVTAGGAEEGATPGGAVIATTKITAKIKALDTKERTATLVFADGKEDVFEVRPDVDMSKYKAGQSVVFLITDLLALEVKKL